MKKSKTAQKRDVGCGKHRKSDQLRPILFKRDFTKYAAGSVLVQWGDTWVLCTASVEDKVPPFLKRVRAY